MIAAGIDPGTSSYEIVAIEGEKVVYTSTLPTKEVRESPNKLIDEIAKSGAEIIAGLSGYGLPIKKFSELDDVDIFLMTLNLEKEASIGLRKLVEIAKSENLNVYTVPGIIHLPTVPTWRKMNKIDIGTADKLCSVVLAAYELSKEVALHDLNFILAEVGYGFNAFIAVKEGMIVDGVGGTSGFPGYSSLGSMDSELAYLIGSFPKKLIFSGGVKNFARDWNMKEKEFEILAEFVLKGLRVVETSVDKAEFCILSGKFARSIKKYISEHYQTRILRGFGKGKQSAQGAAIIANGIAGGEFKGIVEHLKIFEAEGTVLDYITSDIVNYLKEGLKRIS